MQSVDEHPDLSIIIVNWNSVDFVQKCISSLYAQTLGLRVETIVIDNASHDGCGKMLAHEFPNVKFIQGKDNFGFGCANNTAFLHSSGGLVLFLNPDTEAYGGSILGMVKVLATTSDAGIIGAKLLNSDGTVQTSCIQKFPTILSILLDSDFLRSLFPKWSLWGMRPLFDNHSEPVEVDVVSGACQMMRRDVFLRAQMYSTAYFMYAEDVDLCLRANRLGFRNLYIPDAVFVHHGGKSSSAVYESNWSAIVMRESLKRFFESNRSRTYAVAFQVAVGIEASLRIVLIWLATQGARMAGRSCSLAMAKRKWTSILRWALGQEQWAGQLHRD